MLDHADGAKREDAVFLLSSLQTPSTLPALLKALGDRTNSRVREAAAEALGRSKLTQALPSLEAALQDPEPRVRDARPAPPSTPSSNKIATQMCYSRPVSVPVLEPNLSTSSPSR
jgi:HEAT repeat protein